MTLAKGLASGVPIGACLVSGPATGVFKPGNHGSTFGGNPLACAAALETLAIIEDEKLMANAVAMGDLINAGLRAALAGSKGVREIRNKGLMIGIELDMECNQLVKDALADGLLINVTADNVVRLLPPLNMQRAEAEQLVKQLGALINRFLANAGAAPAAVKSA